MAAEDAEIIEGEVIEETPEPAVAKETAKPAKSTRGKAGWLIAGLLGAFIAGTVAFPYMKAGLETIGLVDGEPEQSIPQDTGLFLKPQDIEALEAASVRHSEMLAQLAERISSLEAQPATAGSNPDETQLQAITATIAALEKQVADQHRLLTLRQQEAGSASERPVDTVQAELLERELAKLKAQTELMQTETARQLEEYSARLAGVESGSVAGTPQGRLYVALLELRRKALGGQDITKPLTGLLEDERFVGKTDKLSSVESLRNWFVDRTGPVVPLADLQVAFDKAVKDFTRARHKEEGTFLSSLFTVRNTGKNAEGDDAALLQAEKALAKGDIASALAETLDLQNAAKAVFAPWQEQAEDHLLAMVQFESILEDVRGAGY